MQDEQLSEDEISRFIQVCLSDDDVPEDELATLEGIMQTESQRAKDIALRLLDESMIRSWFRSEADTVFINEVQKRLDIRFKDREFIEAVMSKVEEGISSSTPGEAGEAVVKEEIKSVSMMKYILAPIIAAVLYLCIFQMDFIKAFFRDAESFMMTVEDISGQPNVISQGKRKTVVLKMLIKPGDTLNTGSKEKVILKYPDQTTVELGPDTNVILVESGVVKELQHLSGKLKLSVHPQGEKTPFTVHSNNADVRISEGITSISVQDKEDLIEVLSGSVIIGQPGMGNNQQFSAGRKVSVSKDNIHVLSGEKDKVNSENENE